MKKSAYSIFGILLAGVVAWGFLPVFRTLSGKWATDPQYSHGYLVPALAGLILFVRREKLAGVSWSSSFVGFGFIALASGIYAAGGYLQHDWITGISLVPLALGVLGLFGGAGAIKWGWPAALFLGYMVPLPYQIETALSLPLRSLATQYSTWSMQSLGLTAIPEGNIIHLEQGRVSVAKACSGLSMFLTFFALGTAFLIVARPPWLETILVMLSIPVIAVLTNVIRITITGIAVTWWGTEVAHDRVHDRAGWLMMPIAGLLLGVELWAIGRAFPLADEQQPIEQTLLPTRLG